MGGEQEHGGRRGMARVASALAGRLKGPGGLYNLGNAIGFFGGLSAAIFSVPPQDYSVSRALAAAADSVSGSPPALALTLATVVFFWSGEEYHRAWSRGYPPDETKIRIGDLSSAVGAVLLAFSFLALGNLILALTAGVMHASGKLGSAWGAARAMEKPGTVFRYGTLCREVVLLSRLPAMAMALRGYLDAGTDSSAQIVNAVLLACCFIWAAADMQLLPADSLLSPRRYLRGPRREQEG